MADECLVDERDESHAAATGTQSSTTAPTAGQPRGNLTAAPSVPPGGLTDRVRIASYTGPPAAAVPAELAGVASRSSGPSPRPRDNTSPSTNHQLPLACPGAAVYFLLQLHETGKQNHGADDSLGDGAAVAPGPRPAHRGGAESAAGAVANRPKAVVWSARCFRWRLDKLRRDQTDACIAGDGGRASPSTCPSRSSGGWRKCVRPAYTHVMSPANPRRIRIAVAVVLVILSIVVGVLIRMAVNPM